MCVFFNGSKLKHHIWRKKILQKKKNLKLWKHLWQTHTHTFEYIWRKSKSKSKTNTKSSFIKINHLFKWRANTRKNSSFFPSKFKVARKLFSSFFSSSIFVYLSISFFLFLTLCCSVIFLFFNYIHCIILIIILISSLLSNFFCFVFNRFKRKREKKCGKKNPIFCFIDVTHTHTQIVCLKMTSKQRKENHTQTHILLKQNEFLFIYMYIVHTHT